MPCLTSLLFLFPSFHSIVSARNRIDGMASRRQRKKKSNNLCCQLKSLGSNLKACINPNVNEHAAYDIDLCCEHSKIGRRIFSRNMNPDVPNLVFLLVFLFGSTFRLRSDRFAFKSNNGFCLPTDLATLFCCVCLRISFPNGLESKICQFATALCARERVK